VLAISVALVLIAQYFVGVRAGRRPPES
jgi:hypothetical protein